MKKNCLSWFLLLGTISSLSAALDLTPNEIKAASEGPPAKRYFFRDAGKQLAFRIDSKMSVSGTSGAVAFLFQDINGASFKMMRSPTSAAIPFDEKNLPAYLSVARGFVPPDASAVEMEGEVVDPISINGWTSHQYSFRYNLFGFPHRRSITFLNYNEQEQLILDVSGKADDYEKAYSRAFRVLNSISASPFDPNGPT